MPNAPEQIEYTPDLAIALYLDARIDSAKTELDKAVKMYHVDPNVYTRGKLTWCENQLSALQIARRDAERWESVLKNYARRIRKRRYKT